MQPNRPPEAFGLLVRQAAPLIVAGASVQDLVTQLNITRGQAKKVFASDELRSVVRELSDEAMVVAKQSIRHEMGKMAGDVIQVIRDQLKKGNLEAVKVALKVMGFDQEEPKQADTHIQVVLPGKVENVIETSSRDVTE